MTNELTTEIRILIARAVFGYDRNDYDSDSDWEADKDEAGKELIAALYAHFNAKEGDQYLHKHLPHGEVGTLVGFDRHWDNPQVMCAILRASDNASCLIQEVSSFFEAATPITSRNR
jgi:hypothetical protein